MPKLVAVPGREVEFRDALKKYQESVKRVHLAERAVSRTKLERKEAGQALAQVAVYVDLPAPASVQLAAQLASEDAP